MAQRFSALNKLEVSNFQLGKDHLFSSLTGLDLEMSKTFEHLMAVFCTTWHSMMRKKAENKSSVGRWDGIVTDWLSQNYFQSSMTGHSPSSQSNVLVLSWWQNGAEDTKILKQLQGTYTSYTRMIFRSSRFDHTPALTKLHLCCRFIIFREIIILFIMAAFHLKVFPTISPSSVVSSGNSLRSMRCCKAGVKLKGISKVWQNMWMCNRSYRALEGRSSVSGPL